MKLLKNAYALVRVNCPALMKPRCPFFVGWIKI